MANQRKAKILKMLMKIDVMTTNEMALLFHVSSKTIRNDVKEINEEAASIGRILPQPGKGMHLEVTDREKLLQMIERYTNEQIYTPEQRVRYIINYLLSEKNSVSSLKLASHLYISNFQLGSDIKRANKQLSEYGLEIISKGKKGYSLSGAERNKRRYLVDDLNQFSGKNTHLFSESTRNQLRNGITDIFDEVSYTINEEMLEYLMDHIVVSMMRYQEGFFLEADEVLFCELCQMPEYRIAERIASWILTKFQCTFSSEEIVFLTLQLLSNKEASENTAKDEDIQNMIQTTLAAIHQKFGIDFSEDDLLKQSLYLHMLPLMNRIRYDLDIRNPLVSEIKIKYPLTYDLAGEVALLLNQQYQYKLSENELAYLSIHFNLALERYKKKKQKWRILLATPLGTRNCELIEYRLKEYLKEHLSELITLSPRDVPSVDLSSFDLIISTKKLNIETNYIYIASVLDDEHLKQIHQTLMYDENELYLINCISSQLIFTDIKGTNKKDILMQICKRLKNVVETEGDLYSSVMEREKLLTTEIGNLAAFPHPLNPISTKTFMSVTILDKPVLWDSQLVQVVFLSAIGKDNEKSLNSFYASFAGLVKSEMKIAQLLSKRNFETLLSLIQDKQKGG